MHLKNHFEYLKYAVIFASKVALWTEFDLDIDIQVEIPKDIKNGDLSIVCMSLAKIIKENPKVIAERMKPYLDHIKGIEKVEVVYPGYLNIYFNRVEFLTAKLKNH